MNDTDKYWSDIYDKGRDYMPLQPQAITKILGYVDQPLPKTCLDIGCGTGQLTRELYHRGYKCVGIDTSSSAIKLAKSLTQAIDYIHLDIEETDLNLLPDKPYSLITCKFVYAFIKDKTNFLKKAASLLEKGGVFVVITPLKKDVPPHKADIAVDFDQTMAELKAVFSNIEHFETQGDTVFICKL